MMPMRSLALLNILGALAVVPAQGSRQGVTKPKELNPEAKKRKRKLARQSRRKNRRHG